jgi:hypothetical protein
LPGALIEVDHDRFRSIQRGQRRKQQGSEEGEG